MSPEYDILPNRPMTLEPTHYQVLGLPTTLQQEPLLLAHVLRQAYRRALLQNHPDKAGNRSDIYSVDQITDAYSILGDPQERTRYDRELKVKLQREGVAGNLHQQNGFKTGMETMDLDDLVTDDGLKESIWYRGCRCGDERGFELREEELEAAVDAGEAEVVVGCRGCSLWLRVLFGVVEEGQEDGKNDLQAEDDEESIGG